MSADRLLPEVLTLSASALENWQRCPRLYFAAHVLRIPASDGGRSPDFGLFVHGMLRQIHERGSCRDAAHVAEVLALHGASADGAVGAMVARHARRCPSPAPFERHERELARFHRRPGRPFMVVGRLDAVWAHGDVLEVRDYKTGARTADRLADDPRARLQAWLAEPVARRRGLRLRVRYEQLAAEVDEDPEPFEPDEDDLATITHELSTVAAAIRDAAATGGFRGVADAMLCNTCRYRSVCRDSAAPGVPSWPSPPDLDDGDGDGGDNADGDNADGDAA